MHNQSDDTIPIVFIDGGFNKGQTYNRIKLDMLYDRYYAFDPDPRNLKAAAVVCDNKFSFSNSAIWASDIVQPFNLCNREDEQGGSLFCAKWSQGMQFVNCIDFDRWTRQTLLEDDYNILKLDIEGAEYAVIIHLINNGTLFEFYDELWVEFHKDKHFESEYPWQTDKNTILTYCESNNINVKILK